MQSKNNSGNEINGNALWRMFHIVRDMAVDQKDSPLVTSSVYILHATALDTIATLNTYLARFSKATTRDTQEKHVEEISACFTRSYMLQDDSEEVARVSHIQANAISIANRITTDIINAAKAIMNKRIYYPQQWSTATVLGVVQKDHEGKDQHVFTQMYIGMLCLQYIIAHKQQVKTT